MQPPIFTPYQPPPQPPAPMRVRLDGLADSWNVVKTDFTPFVLATVAMLVVTIGLFALLLPLEMASTSQARSENPFASVSPFASPILIVTTVISTFVISFILAYVYATCQRIALLRLRGIPAPVAELFNFAGRGALIAGWAALYGSICVVLNLASQGLQAAVVSSGPLSPMHFLAIFGGAAISTVVQALVLLTPLMILDQGMSPLSALLHSVQVVGPRLFPVFGMYLLVSVLGAIGLIACCVGILFTAPISLAWPAVLYNDFYRPQASTQPKENEFYPRPQY